MNRYCKNVWLLCGSWASASLSKMAQYLLATLLGGVLSPLNAAVFDGRWNTEDGETSILIEICGNIPGQHCGYLVRFPTTEHPQLDRALCGFRILGGLSATAEGLEGGWLFDLESGSAHNLIIRGGKTRKSIELRLFGRFESLGETVHWARAAGSSLAAKVSQEFSDCAY